MITSFWTYLKLVYNRQTLLIPIWKFSFSFTMNIVSHILNEALMEKGIPRYLTCLLGPSHWRLCLLNQFGGDSCHLRRVDLLFEILAPKDLQNKFNLFIILSKLLSSIFIKNGFHLQTVCLSSPHCYEESIL